MGAFLKSIGYRHQRLRQRQGANGYLNVVFATLKLISSTASPDLFWQEIAAVISRLWRPTY